jgi:hypothetical protein
MCFNKEVSLLVFIIALIVSVRSFLNEKENDELINSANSATSKPKGYFIEMGLFILATALMQLIEYFIWKNQNTKSLEHQIWSFLIYITFIVQILMMAIPVFYYRFLDNRKDLLVTFSLFFGVAILSMLAGLIPVLQKFGKYKSIPATELCKLKWPPLEILYKENFMLYLLITISYHSVYLLVIYLLFGWVGIAAIILITIISNFLSGFSIVTYGSILCFSVIIFFLLVVLIDKDDLKLHIGLD